MFNDWLLQEMNKRGLSQADLARASGLTTAAIQNLSITLNQTPLQLAKGCGFTSVYEYQKWLTDEISKPGGSDEDDTMKMLKAFNE